MRPSDDLAAWLYDYYEAKGYKVKSVTEPWGVEVGVFKVHFDGRGPYGMENVYIQERSVQRQIQKAELRA